MVHKPLPPDYMRHEQVYARNPAAPGWSSPAVDAEILSYVFELLDVVNLKPPARILELGCGMGNLSIPLAKAGFSVEGVDISHTAIRVASNRASALGVSATFRVEDVTKSAFVAATHRYAAILVGLCWHCIIGSDRPTLLRSIARSLEPGGVFLVMTMCGIPRLERIVARFDVTTNCVTDGMISERYSGSVDALLEELRLSSFHILYRRLVRGNEVAGNEDLLLVVARVDR